MNAFTSQIFRCYSFLSCQMTFPSPVTTLCVSGNLGRPVLILMSCRAISSFFFLWWTNPIFVLLAEMPQHFCFPYGKHSYFSVLWYRGLKYKFQWILGRKKDMYCVLSSNADFFILVSFLFLLSDVLPHAVWCICSRLCTDTYTWIIVIKWTGRILSCVFCLLFNFPLHLGRYKFIWLVYSVLPYWCFVKCISNINHKEIT